MKKVLVVLLVLVLLAGAAAGGYYWYRQSHIFLEEAVYDRNATELDLTGQEISLDHYHQLVAQLPDCRITWDVPFQGRRVPNTVTSLTVTSLTEGDIALMTYFQDLKSVDAMAVSDYRMLENLQYAWPDLEVTYEIDLGGTRVAPNVTELTLEEGSYDYETLMNNMVYLHSLQSLTLPRTTLDKMAVDEIRLMYPAIGLAYTVSFRGGEVEPSATEMDLSDLKPEEVAQTARELAFFPDLQSVELMDDSGNSALSLTDVQTLQEAAPGVQFHYTFTFYKQTLSTLDTQVEYKNKYMKDSDEAEIRQILDVMDNCEKFIFNNCHISNEVMASIREDYRDRTKIVWRVFFGGSSSCLTDKEVIKVVYGLTNSNSKALKYCEDAKYIDFGHNESLTDISFIAYMPKLEAIILSGSPITDLSPFENNKSLYFLELAYCGYIEDLTPLQGCDNLGMLNISFTAVPDLTALDGLNLERLTMVRTGIADEEVARYRELKPECWLVSENGNQPYGEGWRYEEDGSQSDYYVFLASKEIFNYAHTSDTLW